MKKIMAIVVFLGILSVLAQFGYEAYSEYELYRVYNLRRKYVWTSPETMIRYTNLTQREYDGIREMWENGKGTEEILATAAVDWSQVEVDTWTWDNVTTWDNVQITTW